MNCLKLALAWPAISYVFCGSRLKCWTWLTLKNDQKLDLSERMRKVLADPVESRLVMTFWGWPARTAVECEPKHGATSVDDDGERTRVHQHDHGHRQGDRHYYDGQNGEGHDQQQADGGQPGEETLAGTDVLRKKAGDGKKALVDVVRYLNGRLTLCLGTIALFIRFPAKMVDDKRASDRTLSLLDNKIHNTFGVHFGTSAAICCRAPPGCRSWAGSPSRPRTWS